MASTSILTPTADFIATTLNGALAGGVGDTTATIGTGLSIPATNGILQIHPDSTIAVGTDEGPETVSYATYTTGTGAIAGMTRGLAGTTRVAHASGAKVSCGMSSFYLNGTTTLVSAKKSVAQDNVTDVTWTKVTLGSENYDVGDDFANSTFTVPVAGKYLVTAQVVWDNPVANKTSQIGLYVDGVLVRFAGQAGGTDVSQEIMVPITCIFDLTVGQTVELYARHISGAATPDLPIQNSTFMDICLISQQS